METMYRDSPQILYISRNALLKTDPKNISYSFKAMSRALAIRNAERNLEPMPSKSDIRVYNESIV